MICRLCLRCLSPGSAVFLFETDETLAETRLVKMIAKFLQLEVSVVGAVESLSLLTLCLLFAVPRSCPTTASRPACAPTAASTWRTSMASGSW